MKDREYLQEMAYIEAEKEYFEQKEIEQLDKIRLPAKITILKKDEYGNTRKVNNFAVNPLPF